MGRLRIVDLPVDGGSIADMDKFVVDSTIDGTRCVAASDVRTYMQAGVAVDLSGYETTTDHDDDLAANATADRARANHTGTQLAATVSDFAAAAAAAAPVASVAGRTGAVVLAAADIASGQLAMARIASGTPDGTKFVRDDGTLVTPAGGSTPNARILALKDTKTDVTSGTSTVAFLSYTVDRSPSDWIAAGLMYRAVLTGRCANTSGSTRTLDLSLTFDGTAIITVRLPIATTVSPTVIPWTFEALVSCPGDDLLWVNCTAYLGIGFNGTTGLVDSSGSVYAGSKQTGSITTVSTPSLTLATTYKRDSTVSTYTVTLANSFIQQIQV